MYGRHLYGVYTNTRTYIICVCVCVHKALKLHDYRDCIHNVRDGTDCFFLLLLLLFVYTRTQLTGLRSSYMKLAFTSPIIIIQA